MADDLKKIIKNELLELVKSKKDPDNKQGFIKYISKTGELMKESKTIDDFHYFEEKRGLAKFCLRYDYHSFVEESYIPVPENIE